MRTLPRLGVTPTSQGGVHNLTAVRGDRRMWSKIRTKRFFQDETGIALSEYVIVLALLLGGVIVAVLVFGNNLSNAWHNWANWMTSGPPSPPT